MTIDELKKEMNNGKLSLEGYKALSRYITVQEEIRDLEEKIFILDMKDHFDADDFSKRNMMVNRIKELKNEYPELF